MELGWRLAAGNKRSSVASASVRPASRVSLSMTVSITRGWDFSAEQPFIAGIAEKKMHGERGDYPYLGGCEMLLADVALGRAHNARDVICRAHVGCSSLQGRGPQGFIG